MTTTLYGIKSCDTVRKARRWLEQHEVEYRYHDLRDDGLELQQLVTWSNQVGWEALLNRRSTTWKQLATAERVKVSDADSALALLKAHPTLLKRPLLTAGQELLLGFDPERYAQWFKRHTL